MFWFIVIFSVVALIVSIFGIKWHIKLNDELKYGNALNVEYGDYILSAYVTYLLTPASICCLLAGIYLVIYG